MMIHRIARNMKARIPLDADRIIRAVMGATDITAKYEKKCGCFMLGHDDTDGLQNCDLKLEFEKDGATKKATHAIEVA